MQTEIKTIEKMAIRVIPTDGGVKIDTWPVGALGLDLNGIDQLVEILQAQAARLRAISPEGQMGLFDKVAQ